MVFKAFLSAPPLTRIAAILFLFGKVCFFFTVLSAFISNSLALVFLVVYAASIAAAIVLSLIDIFKLKREGERGKPSVDDVRRWAKEYNLIGEEK